MAQIRFYIDEDAMRSSFVNALRSSGLDIVTVAEVDRLGYSDAKQLAWATEQGRVLYSFNVKDFSFLHNQLLAQGNSHAGIVVVPRQRYSIGEQLRGILNLANCLDIGLIALFSRTPGTRKTIVADAAWNYNSTSIILAPPDVTLPLRLVAATHKNISASTIARSRFPSHFALTQVMTINPGGAKKGKPHSTSASKSCCKRIGSMK